MNKILLMPLLWLTVFYGPVKANATTAPRINPVQLEYLIHQQINHERQKYGLAPLVQDEQLTVIARNHSLDMARYNFFSHINPQGEGPAERAKRQGWDKQKQIGSDTLRTGLSENIFQNRLYSKILKTIRDGITIDQEYIWYSQEQIAQTTVQGWMDSPAHRQNILSPLIDRQGIGVAISGNDVYVTEDMF
jgi:uncharacterized protein YkwD